MTEQPKADPAWNYTLNGTDWTHVGHCGAMFVTQSPFDVTRVNNT